MADRAKRATITDNQLTLTTATTSYPIVVGTGVLELLPDYLAAHNIRGTLWLVSDSEVFPHYGDALETLLSDAGYTVQPYIIPSGEASKSQEHLWHLYTWMIGGGVERRDCMIALGGGVTGDLTGFAAATILRGIHVVQIPTTLLAMIDSALGGKTGINHPLGKNLVGAFHHPQFVLADTHTLCTLPLRELRSGWAEGIKHGIIQDRVLFEQLEAHAALLTDQQAIAQADSPVHILLGNTIRQAAAVKVAVVSGDEREKGQRIFLNYGHTLGHALETALNYGTLLHGEAVAIGMHHAAKIAATLGVFTWEDVARQQRVLTAYHLPTDFPVGVDRDYVCQLTMHDKKVKDKRVQWVLPTGIGSVTTRDDVPESVVREVLGV